MELQRRVRRAEVAPEDVDLVETAFPALKKHTSLDDHTQAKGYGISHPLIPLTAQPVLSNHKDGLIISYKEPNNIVKLSSGEIGIVEACYVDRDPAGRMTSHIVFYPVNCTVAYPNPPPVDAEYARLAYIHNILSSELFVQSELVPSQPMSIVPALRVHCNVARTSVMNSTHFLLTVCSFARSHE